jgi:hypothetical protein
METIYKERLFVLLRALDRLADGLQKLHAPPVPDVVKFVDELWFSLAKNAIKTKLGPVKKALTHSIVDEQDASYELVVRNMYLYAIGDLVEFVKEGRLDSLDAADERVVDLYDYVAGQKYVREKMKGTAVILTKGDEERIRADPDYQEGLARISEDRNIAQNISEWSEVQSRRYQ